MHGMGSKVQSSVCVSNIHNEDNQPMKKKPRVRPINYDERYPVHDQTSREKSLAAGGRIYEYSSAADPDMPPVPQPGSLALMPIHHQSGPTRIIPFDLSDKINTPYAATSPNLLVGFIRILGGESINTKARATSQAFYVISGKGKSHCEEHGVISWALGDMIVLPRCPGAITHLATEPTMDCALYWISDEPLLRYLGVTPSEETFAPTVIRREQMLAEVERISHEPGAEHRNRMGILLGNKATDYSTRGGSGTLTLTPTLWSLLNVLPPHDAQKPHRHNSVALDLAVYAKPADATKGETRSGVYTMMGPELDEATGQVKDGIRCDWVSGAVFITPPGWWHSHHNETDEPAWVLPMQDAGLYTYQRVLDIQFSTSGPDPATAAAAKGNYETLCAAFDCRKNGLSPGGMPEVVAAADDTRVKVN